MDDVYHLENSSSGAKNSIYNAVIQFFTISSIRNPPECLLNAFYRLYSY